MADLNSRFDSFITLLLDVSGRARPADLEAHVASGADELLQAYAAAHGEMNLAFEGDALVVQASFQAPAPAWVDATPEPVSEAVPLLPEVDIAAVPGADFAQPEAVAAEPTPFVFDPSSLPEVDAPMAASPAEVTAPAPAFGEPPESPLGGVPELDAVVPAVAPAPIPQPSVPVVFPAVAAPASAGFEPTTVSAPVIPRSDESSFFEFGPAPVAEAIDAASGDSEPELLFVPQPTVDEADLVPGVLEPSMPVMVPDLSDLPTIEDAGSSIPEIIPVDPLEGLDETDGF